MATRSLTRVFDERGREVLCLYRHYDGYPSGHGQELADFLAGKTVVNGLGDRAALDVANGMGCLAALLVSHFKKDAPGGFYIHAPGSRGVGEEYVYEVRADSLRCIDVYGKHLVYDGPASAYTFRGPVGGDDDQG